MTTLGLLPVDVPAVERELTDLAADLAAGTCRFLELLAVFDTAGGWHGSGLRTCAQWLSWRCALSTNAAREQLRVAHALTALPLIRRAFGEGRLSYSKVRALTRVATAATEADLLDVATGCTASQLDRLCAGLVRARPDETVLAQAARARFTARWDPDGTLRFSGRLAPEDGAALLAALAAVRPDAVLSPADPDDPADALPAGPDPARPDPADRAAHDDAAALVLIARHALAEPPPAVGSDPVRLVVHAGADPGGTPAGVWTDAPPTVGVLDAAPHLPPLPLGPATYDRMVCEAVVEAAVHPDDPRPARARRRYASARQRRALLRRDLGCAFPGCPRRRGLHAHHLRPWSRGGPTAMRNLVLVCEHHHLLVHEGGWRLTRERGRWVGIDPSGVRHEPAPPTRGERRRIRAYVGGRPAPGSLAGGWRGEPLHLAYAVSVLS